MPLPAAGSTPATSLLQQDLTAIGADTDTGCTLTAAYDPRMRSPQLVVMQQPPRPVAGAGEYLREVSYALTCRDERETRDPVGVLDRVIRWAYSAGAEGSHAAVSGYVGPTPVPEQGSYGPPWPLATATLTLIYHHAP